MSPIVVIATGGRDYPHWDRIFTTFDYIHRRSGIARIYEGGASGADAGARQWALDNGVPNLTFQAEWGKYGKAAGPIRNNAMLQHALRHETLPILTVAFPGGIGTAGMVELTITAIALGYKISLCDLREELGRLDASTTDQAGVHGGVDEAARAPTDRQLGIKRAH